MVIGENMSYWHEKTIKDISFSDDKKEMHIYLYNDDSGSVYISLNVSDIKNALLTNEVIV